MAGYGLFREETTEVIDPPMASEADLERVHSKDYVDVVEAISEPLGLIAPEVGLGGSDNPVFPNMHAISATIVGGSIEAARRVYAGELDYAFNMAGGLHHALPNRASGFCIYNDPAVAIAWLLNRGVDRIVYIDTDAHHGDGVQWIFYDDPRVMTISIHESGKYLFPGTGDIEEIGRDKARGTSINVPLEPGASDADVLLALDEAALPLARQFKPDMLVLQHGCDTHRLDPLTHLECTMDVFHQIGVRERDLARDLTGGRAISGGGGGYAFREVVPRAWTSTFAAYCDIDLPQELPRAWREEAKLNASSLMEDDPAPDEPLPSTGRTIQDLKHALGRFQG